MKIHTYTHTHTPDTPHDTRTDAQRNAEHNGAWVSVVVLELLGFLLAHVLGLLPSHVVHLDLDGLALQRHTTINK